MKKKTTSSRKTATRNKFEQRIERQLKKYKVNFKYEAVKIPYVIAGHYIPDFCIETRLGKIYVETKGYFRNSTLELCSTPLPEPTLDGLSMNLQQ